MLIAKLLREEGDTVTLPLRPRMLRFVSSRLAAARPYSKERAPRRRLDNENADSGERSEKVLVSASARG
jgi:hypothetical protein